MLCNEVIQLWERLEISFTVRARLDRVIFWFLLSFSWLGDMVCSLIHDGDENKGQLGVHANTPLLCWNDPDSRFCCLQLTSGSQRISGSNSYTDRRGSSGQEGRRLHPHGYTGLPAPPGPVSCILCSLRPDQQAQIELLCSPLEIALTSFAQRERPCGSPGQGVLVLGELDLPFALERMC